jgi:hypothetical protein
MGTLAIHLSLARDGQHVERIEAAGWGVDMVVRARVECLIRPDGWRTENVSQAIAEREGLEGDDVRCALRLIGGQTLKGWTGLANSTSLVIMHGEREQSDALTRLREEYGMKGIWRRNGLRVIDTRHLTALALGTTRPMTLEHATKEIVGRPISGVDGILALINTPKVGEQFRRTA